MKKVFKNLIIFFSIFFISPLVVAQPWVEWNTKQGTFLHSSQINQHAWKLLPYYERQRARANCGIATTVTALNSLALPSPVKLFGVKLFASPPIYNQVNFFSPQVERVVRRNEVERRGISLSELKNALKTFRWLRVYPYEGPRLSHAEIRYLLITSLRNPNQRVLGLFDRRVLKQRGTGHWSPIAAYNRKTDSFLVLDVNNVRYKPFWVKATALFNSMQTYNGRQSRGMLVVEKIQ